MHTSLGQGATHAGATSLPPVTSQALSPPHSLPLARFVFLSILLPFPFRTCFPSFLVHAGWQVCELHRWPAGRTAHTPTSKRQVSFKTEHHAW